MAKFIKVDQSAFDGAVVIEDDVGDVFDRDCGPRWRPPEPARQISSAGVLSSRKPSTARSTSMRGYCSMSSRFQSWQAVK